MQAFFGEILVVGAHAVLKRARPDAMIERLALDWDARRLATLRFDAQRLVQKLRPRIRAVAAALV